MSDLKPNDQIPDTELPEKREPEKRGLLLCRHAGKTAVDLSYELTESQTALFKEWCNNGTTIFMFKDIEFRELTRIGYVESPELEMFYCKSSRTEDMKKTYSQLIANGWELQDKVGQTVSEIDEQFPPLWQEIINKLFVFETEENIKRYIKDNYGYKLEKWKNGNILLNKDDKESLIKLISLRRKKDKTNRERFSK